MKKSICLFAVMLMTLTAINGCKGVSEKSKEVCPPHIARLTNGDFIDSERLSGDTIGYVAGKFVSPEATDTLYCIVVGCQYPDMLDTDEQDTVIADAYVLCNSSTSIPDLYLTNNPYINHIRTADLDGDGLDEIYLQNTWYISCWNSFSVIDLQDGVWTQMCQPLPFYACNFDVESPIDSVDVVKYHSDGKLLVYTDQMSEDFTDIERKESIIDITRTPLTYALDSCYVIPSGDIIVLPVTVKPQD